MYMRMKIFRIFLVLALVFLSGCVPYMIESMRSDADLNEANAGVNEANAGVNEANTSVNEANTGVNEANAGVNEANAGVNKANAGVNKAKPKRVVTAAPNTNEERSKLTLQRQYVVSAEEFTEILAEFLKEKYDKDFEIDELNNLNYPMCQFQGKAHSVPEDEQFEFWAALYTNDAISCGDGYFQYVIRDVYEKYISDIVAQVWPENKVFIPYSDSIFQGVTKDTTLEEIFSNSKEDKKTKNVMDRSSFEFKFALMTILIHAENSNDRKREIADEIAKALYDAGFTHSARIVAVKNDGDRNFSVMTRTEGTMYWGMDLLEWACAIYMRRETNSYEVDCFRRWVDGEQILEW